jgi:hypothetical protein
MDEPTGVQHDDRAVDRRRRHRLAQHRRAQEPGDADPGSPGTQDDGPLRRQRLAGCAQRREHPAEHHRGGPWMSSLKLAIRCR